MSMGSCRGKRFCFFQNLENRPETTEMSLKKIEVNFARIGQAGKLNYHSKDVSVTDIFKYSKVQVSGMLM